VTRERKLREVLNVRLDEPLSREIRRIATARKTTESQVARELLGYGAEVARKLEASELIKHYAAKDDRPHRMVIEARYEPYTDAELDEMGYHW
jgi:predicted transcriptional regulator